MDARNIGGAAREFADYFGALGARWGMPPEACRVHALLFAVDRALPEREIAAALDLAPAALADALAFLVDFRLVRADKPDRWRTGGDAWDLLMQGLEERRRREMPAALVAMARCRDLARREAPDSAAIVRQIGKMQALLENLRAIGARASPQMLRGLVGISARAARLLDRAFPPAPGRS